MNKATFTTELRRYLKRRLPQSSAYTWSRRVEGALVRSEGNGTFGKVLFIIDSELQEGQIKALFNQVYASFYEESVLRKSRFNYIIWNKEGFDDQSIRMHSTFYQMSYFKEIFESIHFTNEVTGNWDVLEELYAPCRGLGQVIIFTTEEKVKLLESSRFSYIKNSVVVYPTTNQTSDVEMHRYELCLGLEVM